ncbi:MAG: endonuclease III domain-containing protein [Candidatus Eisenbacteria bacterium]|nr:endonuclease III domain-containing protein [Candidatus Eisenbacteria bacterium]
MQIGPHPATGRGAAARPARGLGPQLLRTYEILRARNGHLGWWPGRTRIEVIVGAILTQNTAWSNVERAIARLRAARLLSVAGLRRATDPQLEAAIRPSGYFRQKRRKLRAFLALLDRAYGGSLARMARAPTAALRAELLATWGIGPETADSILLYAFGRPVFVVDAYTERIAMRHGWIHPPRRYDRLQALFTRHLPTDADLYNDYHAQLVWVGKHHCRPQPRCHDCPLRVLPGRRQIPGGSRATEAPSAGR